MHQSMCAPPSSASISKFISDHPSLTMLETSCTDMRELQMLHSQLIRTGLAKDTIAVSRVLAFCATSPSGDVDYALRVFSQIEHPNAYTWNTAIRGLSQSSTPHLAISLFHDMLHSPTRPQSLTYPALFTAYAHLGRAENGGAQLHGMVLKLGFAADTYVRNAMLSMYAACGNLTSASRVFDGCTCFDVVAWNSMLMGLTRIGLIDEAQSVFDDMPERSVVTWSTMMSGYVRNGRFAEALGLFLEMQQAGIEPNSPTLVSVLRACACLGALEQGEWIHGFLRKHRIEANPIVLNAITDMYCKCGRMDKALQVFDSSPKKVLSSWNCIISGLAMHGRGEEAVRRFSMLQSVGLRPDYVTFIGILTACNHSGMVDEARKYFSLMTELYGIEPTIEHYGCMVDVLGRAGLLEEVEELIREMPMDADIVIWGSLLSACRNNGNIEMSERAAKRIIELDPGDSGGYLLLANAYAGAGHFKDAVDVRAAMKEKRVRRKPGCSMIEVDGVVHEFVIGGD